MTSHQENILILSNSNWNTINFRKSFISHLQKKGNVYVGCYLNQEKIEIEGVNFVEFNNLSRNTISIKEMLSYIKSLLRVIKNNDITSIYVFTFYLSALSLIIRFFRASKGIRIKAIITGLGKLYTSRNSLLNAIFYCGVILLKKADTIVVQNEFDRQLLARYIPSNRIELVPGSGVSLNNTNIEPTLKTLSESFTFCYVGRLLKSKGIDLIVEGFRLYLNDFPNDKLIIVGDYDSNDKQFRINQSEKNIITFGWSNNVSEIFGKSHGTLLMSDREGMPKSLLESLSNSTPIIAYGAPGVIDIYSYAGSNEIGVVVEERNAKSLSNALRHFRMQDYDNYINMGRNARRLVEEVFSEEIINQKLE
jgi:glycosyltransferase involved in cell wall biosynthesis